jgi:hypothetical protein
MSAILNRHLTDDAVARSGCRSLVSNVVHFGQPPSGRYLGVSGENSAAPCAYEFLAVFNQRSPLEILFSSPSHVELSEASGCIEFSYAESANSELAGEDPLAKLDDIIAAIGESRPWPAPPLEIRSLIMDAVGSHGICPPDIEKWALQLASDVADLAD